MPTYFKGFKQGGNTIPVKDLSAMTWEANAVLGAGNFMPNTVYPLTFASTGNVRVETNNDAVSFIAPIDKNTHYYLSASAGDRFRVALSTTLPANGVNVDVIFSSESVLSKDFDSGNYNYVILLSNIGAIDTSTIKPLLAKFPDTLYAPYAMTNRELTENKVDLSNLTLLTSSDDLNNIKNGGVYSWGSTAPTNTPESIGWAFMIVSKRSDNFLNQMIYKNNAIYTRLYDNGTWGSWYKMAGTAL